MEFRHEYKYYINKFDEINLRQRLLHVAKRDPYAMEDGTYLIKSLYFDNCYDKALCEKQDGLDKREKFRIRYYNDDLSFIRLEKKTKINGMCSKETAPLTKEECEKIISGDCHFLLESDDNLKRELYAKMQYQILRPKNIVIYNREVFVLDEGNVRISFDSNIRGSHIIWDFLKKDDTSIHVFSPTILEVKWDEYLPAIIKDAVQTKDRSLSAFSKYAATRFF